MTSKTTENTEALELERSTSRERGALLMQLPVGKRLDAILACRNAEAVVAAMPAEDFLVTVMEIGPADALPLLALAKVEQLSLVFDVEWWQRADLRPAKALEWLERLETASARKLLEWLYHADFELLVSLFKKWTRVALPKEDQDPLEALEELPPNTLDDQYYWGAQYPQYEALIERMLRLIFEANQGFYRELLNQVIWGLDAEIEEDAYRFHRGRLEDCAIPDYYDALAVYSMPKSPRPAGLRRKVLVVDPGSPTPAFALSLVSEGGFLHQVLQRVTDPQLLDSLRLEMASVANAVMVADQLAPDSSDSLHLAVHKAAGWVSLGLELISGGDAEHAAGALAGTYLVDLFRHGYGAVVPLSQALRRMTRDGWLGRWPGGLSLLDPPWLEAAEHLLERTPRLLPPSGRPLQNPADGLISSRSNLVRAERIVEAILGGGYLFDSLRVDVGAVRGWKLWQGGRISAIEDVTLGCLVWTAAARAVESGDWTAEPLTLSSWPERFRRFEPKRMEGLIRARVAGSLLEEARREAAMAYLEPLFKGYEEETGPFVDGEPPDPGLLGFFLFTHP